MQHRTRTSVTILIRGERRAVPAARAEGLARAGVPFAYLCRHAGRLVAVPVNDR